MNIFIETYGCSANQNNSEIMAGLLEKSRNSRYKIVDSESDADIIILNTCIVKGPTEAKAVTRIKKISASGKKLIVAGCMPQTSGKKIKEISEDIAILGIDNITEIVNIIELLLKGEAKVMIEKKKEIKLGLPKKNLSPAISIIQIAQGCLGSCTYCSVKFAKGHLHSYPIEQIVDEVKVSVSAGIKEIWLTSQDNSAYGKDTGTNLVHLLNKIITVSGDFKIRIGMMNPNHITPMLDELVEVYKSEKIFKFIHIPVQVGNDEVLKKMNRGYTADEFRKIVSAFRKEMPEITVATDIICGFPEETKQQFNDTLDLVDELKLDIVNISRFWLKKETLAAKLKQTPSEEIKSRSKRMASVFNKLSAEKNKKWIGWQGTVIVDDKNLKDGSFTARNDCYKPIILKGKFTLGDILDVKITKSGTHYLIGETI